MCLTYEKKTRNCRRVVLYIYIYIYVDTYKTHKAPGRYYIRSFLAYRTLDEFLNVIKLKVKHTYTYIYLFTKITICIIMYLPIKTAGLRRPAANNKQRKSVYRDFVFENNRK